MDQFSGRPQDAGSHPLVAFFTGTDRFFIRHVRYKLWGRQVRKSKQKPNVLHLLFKLVRKIWVSTGFALYYCHLGGSDVLVAIDFFLVGG